MGTERDERAELSRHPARRRRLARPLRRADPRDRGTARGVDYILTLKPRKTSLFCPQKYADRIFLFEYIWRQFELHVLNLRFLIYGEVKIRYKLLPNAALCGIISVGFIMLIWRQEKTIVPKYNL